MFQGTRKSAWRKSVLLVVVAVLAMTVLAACGKKSSDYSLTFKGVEEGEVVATYKDGKVTKSEFDKYLSIFTLTQPDYEQILAIPEFQKMILEQYVSYKVIGAQASEESQKKAREEVDKQLKDFKSFKKEDKTFADRVKEKKITDEDMATFLMLTSTLVSHVNSKVTDEDKKAAFEKLKVDLTVSTLRHILVGTVEKNQQTGEEKVLRTEEEALARAKEVKAMLDANGDWDALAKQYSDDPGSKEKGGLYENMPGGDWIEPFKIAVLEQAVGAIGEPVLTDFGYHVIKVEKREDKTLDNLTAEDKSKVDQAAAYTHLEAFLKDEMPKQELKITLPEPSPSASPSASPTGSEKPADGDKDAAKESEAPAGDEKKAE